MKERERIIGVDVGGTKVAAGVVDAAGRISSRVRHPTRLGSPGKTVEGMAQAVAAVIEEAGLRREEVRGIGVGIPGLVDPETGVAVASVNLEWRDVPVQAALEAQLGIPCTIENDVKAAALGEVRYGTAQGARNIIYLVVGTGIAAGIVINGKLYRGSRGMAGEIGHAILQPDGPLCKCGAHGCMEALLAGPALGERAGHLGGSPADALSSRRDGASTRVTAVDLFDAAREGDDAAAALIVEMGEELAFALQFLLLAFDPEMIVLGGGVMESGEMLLPAIRGALERHAEQSWVFASVYDPGRLRVSEIQDDIGILGAAALVAEQ